MLIGCDQFLSYSADAAQILLHGIEWRAEQPAAAAAAAAFDLRNRAFKASAAGALSSTPNLDMINSARAFSRTVQLQTSPIHMNETCIARLSCCVTFFPFIVLCFFIRLFARVCMFMREHVFLCVRMYICVYVW